MKKLDLTGTTYGHLTVLHPGETSPHGKTTWVCRCGLCGSEKPYVTADFRSGRSKTCGCAKVEHMRAVGLSHRGKPRPDLATDLSGLVFGRLTVLSRGTNNPHNKTMWRCRCACGIEREFMSAMLVGGKTKSCGCWRVDSAVEMGRSNLRHGHARHRTEEHPTHTSEYVCWRNMRLRCTDPKQDSYPDYGGRGITVCDRWMHSFENFLADVGRKPSPMHSIDRIDNNGNYEPSNIRWATMKVQSNNRRPRQH